MVLLSVLPKNDYAIAAMLFIDIDGATDCKRCHGCIIALNEEAIARRDLV